MEVACSCHQHRARCALTGRGRVKGEMAAFPGATFPLADDPAFDALDFGVAGRLLACGGAFAQQNAEGLALDLAPAGPLTRVWGPATGDAVPSPPVAGAAGAASRGAAGGGGGGAKRRRRESAGSSRAQSDAMAADDDGQFGDDEKDALDESALLSEHLREGSRGSIACSVLDDAGRALVLHAGGRSLDELVASRLEPCRRGQSWRLARLATSPGSVAGLACRDVRCEDGVGRPSSAAQHHGRVLQVTAEAHGDPAELAWVATRSYTGVAFYRLRYVPSAAVSGAGGSARWPDSMALACVGGVRASAGAGAADVVLNPYWGGEAAMLDRAGQVKLWSAGSETVELVAGAGPDLIAQAMLTRAPPFAEALSTLRRAALQYGQLAWGMHPRTLLCAQAYRLSLIDLRSQARQELLRMPCAALAQAGRFYSIGGASAAGAPQEFAAVTSSLVCIFDIRQPAMPMIRWLHHQEYDPPRHLSLSSILLGAAVGDASCRDHVGARLLVTGNERWGEVICYQYGPAGADAGLMALEQPRKLLSLGDCNPWPGDGNSLHKADRGANGFSQSKGQAGGQVRRLCALSVAMFPNVQRCSDGSHGRTGLRKAKHHKDDEMDLQDSTCVASNVLGVVIQMSETAELFAHGLERASNPSCRSSLSLPRMSQAATCFGEDGFRGWVDGDWLHEEEAAAAAEDACGMRKDAQGGAAVDGEGGHDKEDALLHDKEDAVSPHAPTHPVDSMQVDARGMDAGRGDDHALAHSAGQSAAGRGHGGKSKVGSGWVRAAGWGRSRQELELEHLAATRKRLPRPVKMSVAGNRVKRQDEARDLSRVFEFAAGLRGFDGKVAEGARLPDPPCRMHNRWVCEICGFRVFYKRALSAVEKRTAVTQHGASNNRMHVCANCNSGWHSRCIEKLYFVRKEKSLKESRKVPKIGTPHWICPQCTFYAECRARLKEQHLTGAQWRGKLKHKKVRVTINRHQPGGGAWGAADALMHNVERSFQGLGVAQPKGGSDGGYLDLNGVAGNVGTRLTDNVGRGRAPVSRRCLSGAAASTRQWSENVLLHPWSSGQMTERGGAGQSRNRDSVAGLRDTLAGRLVEFVKWPPKTILEILVYVRRDLGMPTLSLSALALCLRKLSSCPSQLARGEEESWGDKDAPMVAMEGHAPAIQAASSLLAQLPDSESVESVSWDKSVALAEGLGATSSRSRCPAAAAAVCGDIQERGLVLEQGSLLRDVCSLVFVARTGVEWTTQQWSAAAMENEGLARDAVASGLKGQTHVNNLSDEAVCDIFLQRPNDQYEDVGGSDGEMTTRQVFDRFNRRKPFARRRPGHPNKKVDGPDSTLKMVARKYSVEPGVVYSIWMRKTRKSVTRALSAARKGAPLVKTPLAPRPLATLLPHSSIPPHALSAPSIFGPQQIESALGEQDDTRGDEVLARGGDAVLPVGANALLPGFGSVTPIPRRADPDVDDDGVGKCVAVSSCVWSQAMTSSVWPPHLSLPLNSLSLAPCLCPPFKHARARVHTHTELKVEMTTSEKGWLKRRDETFNVSVPSTPGHVFATRSHGQMTAPREKPRGTAACASRQGQEGEEYESKKPQDDDALGALLRRLQVEWENASVALGYDRLGAPVHGVWSASADASELSSSSRLKQSSRCVLPCLYARHLALMLLMSTLFFVTYATPSSFAFVFFLSPLSSALPCLVL
jgi:hypothetical protein